MSVKAIAVYATAKHKTPRCPLATTIANMSIRAL
jgi:hypothetical protein